MTEVRRYRADRVPVKWNDDWHVGEVQEVVLASDYDILRAQAVRLRTALVVAMAYVPIYSVTEQRLIDSELAATADLVEHDMSGPDGPVADSSEGYKILPGEEDCGCYQVSNEEYHCCPRHGGGSR